MLEVNILEDSNRWKQSRDKRIISFVHLSSLILIFSGLIWFIISILTGMYVLNALIIVVEILGFLALNRIRNRKIRSANFILLATAALYFSTVCIITSSKELDNFTTHTWFIALSLASYFLLINEKFYIREFVSLFFLALFFVFHFNLNPRIEVITLPIEMHRWISMIDLISALIVIYIITRLFVLEITKAESALIKYSDKLDSLIENLLPKSIAERLKKEGRTFADHFESCSVLFADIVGFTHWAESHSPSHVVDRLNEIFSSMDDFAEQLKLTKIKTIGDAYLVVAGIPETRNDHAEILLYFAEKTHNIAKQFPDLQFRIGIHSGPVVAGVIGKSRIIYDLWGDTVNVASRLENAAHPGQTLISSTTYNLVKEKLPNARLRNITVKGKQEMVVYDI